MESTSSRERKVVLKECVELAGIPVVGRHEYDDVRLRTASLVGTGCGHQRLVDSRPSC